jgi:integrase
VLQSLRDLALYPIASLGAGRPGCEGVNFWGCAGATSTLMKRSRTMKAAGLTPTFRSLRHSHASALIAAGVDVNGAERTPRTRISHDHLVAVPPSVV